MLEYLVLYNSQSGNTKNLAASVFSALPGNSKDLFTEYINIIFNPEKRHTYFFPFLFIL